MPTAAPLAIPAVMLPAGPLNQWDWLAIDHDDFAGVQQSALMRGTPGAFAAYQRKQIVGDDTIAQPGPVYLHSRPYSRGAEAYAPKFGTLNINPIGSGVVAPYRLPTIAGPGARYQAGAIWFDVQTIGTSLKINPTIPMETVAALLATSHVDAMYVTTG